MQMLEVTRLPFSVCMIDAETHLCAICLFKHRYTVESKQRNEEPMTCKGCDILQSDEKIKWILHCFKKIEVYIDWYDAAAYYKAPLITSDITCLQYLQQEKEL